MSHRTEVVDETENRCVEEQHSFIEIDIQNGQCKGRFSNPTEEERKRAYMHRFVHTICVCSSMFALGWSFGLMGPTFPDLRLIIDEDLATASWIFTGWAFGGLVGAIVGGIAYDRLNKTRVFVFNIVGLGMTVAAAPWCDQFVTMLVIHVFIGVFGGVIKTAATADCSVIWGSKARSFLQAVHGFLCIGAIVSPFVSEPFLAKPRTLPNLSSITEDNITFSVDNYKSESVQFNTTSEILGYIYIPAENSTNTIGNTDVGKYVYSETKIFVTYFISGGVCFLSALMFIIVTLIYGNVYKRSLFSDMQDRKVSKSPYLLSKRLQFIFTIWLALTVMFYITSERALSQFLMTFLVSALKWPKTVGANASATFWITFAIGRISAIFILKKLKLSVTFTVYLLIVISGISMLWASAVFNIIPLVFVSIGVIGFGMSPLFGSLLAMESERIREVTGKVSAVFFVFNNVGGMAFPVLLGFLMNTVSEMCFVYFLMSLYVIIVCSMVLIFGFYRYFANVARSK